MDMSKVFPDCFADGYNLLPINIKQLFGTNSYRSNTLHYRQKYYHRVDKQNSDCLEYKPIN